MTFPSRSDSAVFVRLFSSTRNNLTVNAARNGVLSTHINYYHNTARRPVDGTRRTLAACDTSVCSSSARAIVSPRTRLDATSSVARHDRYDVMRSVGGRHPPFGIKHERKKRTCSKRRTPCVLSYVPLKRTAAVGPDVETIKSFVRRRTPITRRLHRRRRGRGVTRSCGVYTRPCRVGDFFFFFHYC